MTTILSTAASALVALIPGLVLHVSDPAALVGFAAIAFTLQFAAWEYSRSLRRPFARRINRR